MRLMSTASQCSSQGPDCSYIRKEFLSSYSDEDMNLNGLARVGTPL